MQQHSRGRTVVALVGAALLGPAFQVLPASAVPTNDTIDVVFVEATEDFAALQLRATDGSRSVDLTTRTPGAYDLTPSMSPDRATVVFESDRLDPAGGLLLVNTDGTGLRRFTVNDADRVDSDPAFTADSSKVVFTRYDTVNDVDEVFVKPIGAGSVASRLYEGSSPDVSGTGRVVFVDGNGDLAVGNLTGGSATSLGTTGADPTWSPDGTEIAYTALDAPGAGERLHIVSADGSNDRGLAVADAAGDYEVGYPQWLPDGQSLTYESISTDATTGDRPDYRIYSVDRLGSRAGRVFEPIGDIQQYEADVQGPTPADVTFDGQAASAFFPVTPARIFDSREEEAAPGPKGRIGAAETVDVQVTGVAGVPANATAAVFNVTAVGGTATTYVAAFPNGSPVPSTSTSNPTAAGDVPNLATVRIGTGGKVSLYNNVGNVDLVVDLAGYYGPILGGAVDGDGYTSVTPTRAYDSRPGEAPTTVLPKQKLGAGGTVDVVVTGVAGVPSNASAVVVNLTGVGPTTSTFLTAYPKPASGSAFPSSSNLNVVPGGDAANVAVVPVGADGSIRLRNGLGLVDVVVDIAGYYSPTTGDAFIPFDPTRFLDTRTGLGSGATRLNEQGFLDLRLGGYRAVPGSVTAVVGNLTGIAPTQQSTLRAYEPSPTLPTVSNLNLREGEVRANAAYLPVGSGGLVRIYNDRGLVNVVTDISGFFTPIG